MRLTSILIILSAIFLMGMASCNKKPDAIECVHVWPEGWALEKTYFRCNNFLSSEKQNVSIFDMNKCIRDKTKPCKWVATDLSERERVIKFYTEQCKGN